MKRFRFKARKSNGRIVTGEIEAEYSAEAVNILRRKELQLITLDAITDDKSSGTFLRKLFSSSYGISRIFKSKKNIKVRKSANDGDNDSLVALKQKLGGFLNAEASEKSSGVSESSKFNIIIRKFRFKARSLNGKIVTGEVEAENKNEALNVLKLEKFNVISIRMTRQMLGVKDDILLQSIRGKISLSLKRIKWYFQTKLEKYFRINDHMLFIFTHQLSTLLNAGVNINKSMRSILVSETNKKFSIIINGLIELIEQGYSIHRAFSCYPEVFNRIYLGIMKVGETSGKLSSVMAKQALDIEKANSMRKRFITSLTYPSFVLCFATISIGIMIIYFIPGFINMYKETNMKLPLITGLLVFFFNCIFNPYFWMLFVFVSFFALIVINKYLRTSTGPYNIDYLKLKFPVIGPLLINQYVCIIYLNLATMLECGIPILEALSILKEMTHNLVLKNNLDNTMECVRNGLSLSYSLKDSFLMPGYAVSLVKTGESSGELPAMIRRTAIIMEEYVNYRLETFLSLFEPFIISFLAIVVLLIIIAAILPMYNLINSFSL